MCFQAKAEAKAERESLDGLDASPDARDTLSASASRSPSRSPAKRKNITSVLQATSIMTKCRDSAITMAWAQKVVFERQQLLNP